MRTTAFLTVCLLLMPGCTHQPLRRTAYQPLKIVQTVRPDFPVEMTVRGVTEGEVWLVISVDAEGNLSDRLLLGYTRASFAKAALEALHQWQFKPAELAGVPIASRQEVNFYFNQSGQIVSRVGPDAATRHVAQFQSPAATRLVATEAELDEPLRLDKRVDPPWPAGAPREQKAGRVVIDYFIDGYGRPRLIAIERSDGDAFSQAAVVALMQWRYAAPLRHGAPILVRRTEEFVFQRPG